MVERFHRQLKDALRARECGAEWAAHLPWALLGLRAAPKEDSAISSAELSGARRSPYQDASFWRQAAPAGRPHGSQRRHTRLHTKGQHRAAADAPVQRPLRRPPPGAEVFHTHHWRQARDSFCGEAQGPQRCQDGIISLAAATGQAAEDGRPPVLVRSSTRPQRPDWGGPMEYRRETI